MEEIDNRISIKILWQVIELIEILPRGKFDLKNSKTEWNGIAAEGLFYFLAWRSILNSEF